MRIVLSTNNRHKLEEIQAKLTPLGIAVVSPQDLGHSLDVDETGSTFAQNALLKAQACFELTGLPSIGDDSGLAVDALDGAPGIFSARYGGVHGDDQRNIDKLLTDLAACPEADRSAAFVSVVALVYNGVQHCFEGRCPGEIIDERRGEHGFGYDPVFFLPQKGCTMAEIPLDEKNRISHRARALVKLYDFLQSNGYADK